MTAALSLNLVRPLMRVRQYREFTDAPVHEGDLSAISDAARWSGSASNSQPWRFIVLRDVATIRKLGEVGQPQTRGLQTSPAAIAIILPDDESKAASFAFDEGRAAERILIAATMLGLGAGVSWIKPEIRAQVNSVLGVPKGYGVHTIVAVGHPSPAAMRPKSEPGKARLPREEVVFEERWRA